MEIELVDGKAVRRIERRPDGYWLEGTLQSVVAPDGSLAVLSSSEGPWSSSRTQPWAVNLYGPDGEARRTLLLPGSCQGTLFAYDGSHVFLWDAGVVKVLDTEGRAVQRFSPPTSGPSANLWPRLAPGAEIWLIDRETKRVHRFERPLLPR